ncbi:helix-turn-helix domain-containing protein [Flavobacterium agrisoli]|uniref:Helix-turn-helix transcriptional regulator n=1 Tax=Flavobacterium agrisoli TaxID=2793066 RepID=A0A934PKB2_9FLAO|nr:AraC family transcriptional regulator [Flavobacterium agrisoli]MBK0368919.1 helix-turn-helix transcriptional regulator [Flavobacterium agrisoli]
MKNISLQTAKMEALFNGLQTNFGGDLSTETNEYVLHLSTDLCEGKIEGMTYEEGISYVQFDITFNESISFHISPSKSTPIILAYCSEGILNHRFSDDQKMHVLNKYETAIVTTTNVQENELFFEKDKTTKILLILVDAAAEKAKMNNGLNAVLLETFKDSLSENNNFIHLGPPNFRIAEKIEQLNAIKQKGLVRNLLKEGIFKIILALEIEQHANRATANQSNEYANISIRDIDAVKQVSELIKQQPDASFTIKYLCQKSGLSANKLQEGFKLVHKRTVNDFITNVRIEKAENLIRCSDLNISEIVYSIGFSSRSYFSKIFKEKYNCSPKEYKYSHNSLAITA